MRNPKKIVIDARNRRSSTGRYTDQLVENLQEIDKTNKYIILVEPDDGWQLENKNFRKVPCRFRQFSFNPLDQIAFARQLYKLKPDLVHFTMTQQPLLFIGKVITTTHDLTMLRHTRASRFPSWLHRIGMVLYRFLFWWSHKKSARIIVPTQYVAKDLAKRQPFTKKKTVITNEACNPPISGKSEPMQGIKKPFIFHLGAPYPHKNIQRLISAFAILKDKHPDLQLILAGKMKGQFKTDFEEWASHSSARGSIITPGFVSDEELKWLFTHAECYALPALSEGFGIPGLEAMLYGCPLASSNATCLPEVYGEAAHYFDPYDIDDMAAKIDDVISSKKLQKSLAAKGKKQVAKYSWAKMARETLDIYTKTLR